jgi:hypothetical protein
MAFELSISAICVASAPNRGASSAYPLDAPLRRGTSPLCRVTTHLKPRWKGQEKKCQNKRGLGAAVRWRLPRLPQQAQALAGCSNTRPIPLTGISKRGRPLRASLPARLPAGSQRLAFPLTDREFSCYMRRRVRSRALRPSFAQRAGQGRAAAPCACPTRISKCKQGSARIPPAIV